MVEIKQPINDAENTAKLTLGRRVDALRYPGIPPSLVAVTCFCVFRVK